MMSKPASAASGENRKRNMREESKGRAARRATKRLAQPNADSSLQRAMRFARNLLLLLALGFSSCRTLPEMPANIPPTADGYKKVMEDQLGPIWYRLVEDNLNEVSVGTVKLTFEVPGGRRSLPQSQSHFQYGRRGRRTDRKRRGRTTPAPGYSRRHSRTRA
jgi:hypothetical protein